MGKHKRDPEPVYIRPILKLKKLEMSPGSTGLSNNVLLDVSIIFSSMNRRLVGVYDSQIMCPDPIAIFYTQGFQLLAPRA